MNFIIFQMATADITIFSHHQKTKRKPFALALLTFFHIGQCYLDYAMHLPYFNDAC